MKKPVFTGSCTALVTPMRDGKIHYRRLADYLDFQSNNGTSAVVLCGTTGEGSTLTAEEQNRILEYCTEYNAGRMKILAGVGGNCTATCLERAIVANKIGVDGLLMTVPYYNKTNQQGLVQHFLTVADKVELPMILYNIPQRTGMSISADSYEVLCRHPNINGVKEASGDFSLASEIRYRCGDNLTIWSGNDDCTVPLMAIGAKGVIGVASNILPGEVSKLCRQCLDGNYPAAEKLNRRLHPVYQALFADVNPIPIKYAMNILGMDAGEPRLPLGALSEENQNKILRVFSRYKNNLL